MRHRLRSHSLGLGSLALLSWIVLLTIQLTADEFPKPYNSEKNAEKPLPAMEAAKGFRLPAGFSVDLFATEPDVQNPIALNWDTQGRLWVAENYTYAEREKKFDLSLRDRLLVFTDADGDGKPEKRTVFLDHVQRLTSVEIGQGGVWLMCPPQLLFVPDRNADLQPDGPAEIVLEGFDVPAENYHNFANGLHWGPDGWLYGRCGASAPGKVRRPEQSPQAAIPTAGGIWRYHPRTKVFEALCHGTTNPWGHDWNAQGEGFFVNSVNGHLWHLIPGAHFRRPHTISPNPLVYEPMEMHADHWHWDTGKDWTDSRNAKGEHDKRGGGHAHSGTMIYHGEQWPEDYRGRLFTLNLHGRRANVERLERSGSGYVGRQEPDILFASDPFFRGIDLSCGPDGSVFVLDWSDIGECHEHTGVHRTSGRIFRVRYGDPKPTSAPTVNRWTDEQLLTTIATSKNEWLVRMARRVLVDRTDSKAIPTSVRGKLQEMLHSKEALTRLRSLWVLHQFQALEATDWQFLLKDSDEHVRCWAIRLLSDSWPLDTVTGLVRANDMAQYKDFLPEWIDLAQSDRSGLVRLVLASTLQRLPIQARPALAAALLKRQEDSQDPNLPALIWYGLIPVALQDPQALIPLAAEGTFPKVREWITRRFAEVLSTQPQLLEDLLTKTATKPEAVRRDLIIGLTTGLAGVRQAKPPASWSTFSKEFTGTDAAKFRSLVQGLDVVFGDGRALDEVRKLVQNEKAELSVRKAALETLIEANPPDLRSICETLLKVRFLNSVAVRGLTRFHDPAIGKLIVKHYRTFHPSERPIVIDALASRPELANSLLDLLASKQIPRSDLSAAQVRQIRGFNQAELTKRLTEIWGEWRDSPKEKADLITKLKTELTANQLAKADKSRGRELFAKTCANCHRLYGVGGEIGPDLTGAGRKDLDYLLSNIVDPSAVVSKDFQMTLFQLEDGRSINGIVVAETPQAVTVQTDQTRMILPKSEIEKRIASTVSLMPDGLLNPLTSEQIRDLFAYLMTDSQVDLPPNAKQDK